MITAPLTPAEILAASWSYLRRIAYRAAGRVGLEPDELLQELAVAVLVWADEFDPGRGSVERFAFFWAKRVIARPHWSRWKTRASLDDLPPERLVARVPDPADLAEQADDGARVRAALRRLRRQSPRRARAVALRFGLDGGELMAGTELGTALGVRQTTAADLVRAGLMDLARALGADPDRAMVSRAEGISSGQRRRLRVSAVGS